MPAPEVLAADEIDDFWALGVPLEAVYVPAEELKRALAEARIQLAVSTGSMDTQETGWTVAETKLTQADVERGVVVPKRQRAYETPHEQLADDRDVFGVLWKPFYRAQQNALAGCIPDRSRPIVLGEYARVLGALEQAWASGKTLASRAPLIAALCAEGPFEAARVAGWLESQTGPAHLIRGVRARWVSHDVSAAFAAVMHSVKRFAGKAKAMRLALLRYAVRVVRGRPAPPIVVESTAEPRVLAATTSEIRAAAPKGVRGASALTPIADCKTCTSLEQHIALDYEHGAVRPGVLDGLVAIASDRSGDTEAWSGSSVSRCSTCGTFYRFIRSKDEGHSFMDPTHDAELVTRLSLHAAIDDLGTFPGPGAAEARATHAPRIALVTDSLGDMLARGAAPNWHLQKHACECLTQAGLVNGDQAMLDRLLRHADPVVRVLCASELVELANQFQPYVGQGTLRHTLEQAAREWLAAHSPVAVLAAVIAEPARPSLVSSVDRDRLHASDTHAIAVKSIGYAARLAIPMDDDAFARVIDFLDGPSEQHRFDAVWALIWIVKAAPERAPAIRARLEKLTADVRALPILRLLGEHATAAS